MALIATIGGDVSDSYLTVAEADGYFDAHWSSAKKDIWTALLPDAKDAVLRAATQVIETLRFTDVERGVVIHNYGLDAFITQYFAGQRLSVPRNIDYDLEGDVFVPQAFKDAECEQAVYMINFDDSTIANQLQGVMEEAVAAGGVRIYQQYSHRGSFIAPMALELIKPFLCYGRRLGRA